LKCFVLARFCIFGLGLVVGLRLAQMRNTAFVFFCRFLVFGFGLFVGPRLAQMRNIVNRVMRLAFLFTVIELIAL